MKKLINLTLAASLIAASVISVAPQAMAKDRYHSEQYTDRCAAAPPIGQLAVLGLLLGAVTGGVGTAVAYGAAYAVGGAAIGGGGGLLLGTVSDDRRCHY